MSRVWKLLKSNLLMILTVIGVIVGVVLGIILQRKSPSEDVLLWVGMPGDIFLRLLKLTIIPLICSTIITVTATLDPKKNWKISATAFAFITISNVTAAICGTVAGLLLKPGHSPSKNISSTNYSFAVDVSSKTSDIFSDLLYNFFPDNLLGVALFQSRTSYATVNQTVLRKVEQIHSLNMLGLLFCSFVFGIGAGSAGEEGKPFLKFFKSLASIIFEIMNVFLRFTPIGGCFMIVGPIASVRDLNSTFSQLGFFMVTVITALLVHMVIMFAIYLIFTRSNPFRLLPFCFRTWLISVTTLAPIVAIPDMYNASDKFGIDPQISRFVVPLTSALKGDGSAAFLGASAIFIIQLTNTPITSAMIVTIILLSTSAVFSIPNIPSASLVIVVTILASLGVPVGYVGLLFAIDWFMDRCRTTNLAVLHLYCVAFTHFICKGEFNSDANQIEKPSSTVIRSGPEGDTLVQLEALNSAELLN